MQGTPTAVLAILMLSISVNVGLGVGIFAASAGGRNFYDAAQTGGGAGLGCLMVLIAFWGVAVAIKALRKPPPPATP